MRGSTKTIIFIVYAIVGIYFINSSYNFISIPDVGDWITLVGGVLLIFGGLKYLEIFRPRMYGY